MNDATAKKSPASRALLAAALIFLVRGAAFVALGVEVDDAVGGSLTMGYGLVTSAVTALAMFGCAWFALRPQATGATRVANGILAAVLVAWNVRTVMALEANRRDYAAARDPQSTPERLRELDPRDSIVMHRLAANPATPPDVLATLAESYGLLVHERLLANPSTPDDVRDELTSRER